MTATEPPPALRISGARHAYGSRVALDGVDLSVREGEVLGLLGPNGSGKSTLLAMVAGLLPAAPGTVRLRGEPLDGPGGRLARAQMGVVFQRPSLDLKLSPRANLILAGRLYGLHRREIAPRADALMARTGLADRAREPAQRLSGGMRRRVDLARALVHDPWLLLLDEPTVGLDEGSFRAFWAQLDAARRQRPGLTALVATHRPEEAERCDRLAVMVRGAIALLDTPEAIRARVGGDLVVVEGDRPDELAPLVAEATGLPTRTDDHGAVVVETARGHELIPRLVAALPEGRLRAVSLRRPTLADAFLKITGEALDAEPQEIAA